MTDISDRRWEQFWDAFLRVAELQPELEPDPSKRQLVLDLIGNFDYADALEFGTASVKRADARPLALELAELLIPEVELMLCTVDAPESGEIDEDYLDETLAGYRGTLRLLHSVVDAHATGVVVSAEFREAFESWWEERKAEGDVDAAIRAVETRYAFGSAGSGPEQHRVAEILIDWLYSNDQWRWQAALVLLSRARVVRAAPDMRDAALFAHTDEKRAFADTFNRYADDLEREG